MAKKSGPLGFLGKKQFHPTTFRNRQRVFDAEQTVQRRKEAEAVREISVRAERRDTAYRESVGQPAAGQLDFVYRPDGKRAKPAASEDEDDERPSDMRTAAFLQAWEGDSAEVSASAVCKDAIVPDSASAVRVASQPMRAASVVHVDAVRLREDPMLGLGGGGSKIVLDPGIATQMGRSKRSRQAQAAGSHATTSSTASDTAGIGDSIIRTHPGDDISTAPGASTANQLHWRAAVDRARSVAASMGVAASGLREARTRSAPTVKPVRLKPAAAAALGVSSHAASLDVSDRVVVSAAPSSDTELLRLARAAAAGGDEAEARLLKQLTLSERRRLLAMITSDCH